MGLFNIKNEEADEKEVQEEMPELDVKEDDLEEDDPTSDFAVGNKRYNIAFTQKRISMYERTNKPIMASFVQNGGAFSIDELKSLCAYGLRLEGGPFVNPSKGSEMAADLITENGYLAVYQRVSDALERDCGFLFKGAAN